MTSLAAPNWIGHSPMHSRQSEMRGAFLASISCQKKVEVVGADVHVPTLRVEEPTLLTDAMPVGGRTRFLTLAAR